MMCVYRYTAIPTAIDTDVNIDFGGMEFLSSCVCFLPFKNSLPHTLEGAILAPPPRDIWGCLEIFVECDNCCYYYLVGRCQRCY